MDRSDSTNCNGSKQSKTYKQLFLVVNTFKKIKYTQMRIEDYTVGTPQRSKLQYPGHKCFC